MKIDTVVSITDWFQGWGTWGRPGVYRTLSEIKRAGVNKIHWRTFFGARAIYHSALEPMLMGSEGIDRPGNEAVTRVGYDLDAWDPLVDGVKVAHDLSLPIYAWYTPYEESHYQTKTTSFAAARPDLTVQSRDGARRASKLSFASEEVRSRKVALIDEQIAYGVDGLLLDFFREHHLFQAVNPPRVDVDEDGVCIYGYEGPMVAGFRERFGVDPLTLANNDERWVGFRADQTTRFMQQVREAAQKKRLPVAVKVRSMTMGRTGYWWTPERARTNSYLGSFVDWPTWSKERLVDEVMVILENWDLMDLDWKDVWRETELAKDLLHPSTKLTIGFFMNNMRDRAVRDGEFQLDRCATSAIQAGADNVCLWEAHGIHAWGSVRGGGSGTGIGLWPEVRRLASRQDMLRSHPSEVVAAATPGAPSGS